MKKREYIIIINAGRLSGKPLCYSYRATKNIELYIHRGKVCVHFMQGTSREPEDLLSHRDDLCTDVIKKVLLLHMIRFGSPLDIRTLALSVDGKVTPVLTRQRMDEPLVYSMIGTNLDHPLPKEWQSTAVMNTILSMPKSAYDGRMNSLTALLMAKTQPYRSEKAMFLWMAMNGLYTFLTKALDAVAANDQKIGSREWKQIKALRTLTDLPDYADDLTDEQRKVLRLKAMSIISHIEGTPQALYDSLLRGEENSFTPQLELLLQEYDCEIHPLSFMIVWLPYQIRCSYFHANQAMPIFMYKDESLLKALQFTNYFVERFLEEQLAKWLAAGTLSPEQQRQMLDTYQQNVIRKSKKKSGGK